MSAVNATPSATANASTATKDAAPLQASAGQASQAQILKVAREFESIFLRSLLSPLEKTTQVGKGGSLAAGQSAYGSMVVGAMADTMSTVGGIGLAEVITRALTAHGAESKGPQKP